jgi:hypothetical protein
MLSEEAARQRELGDGAQLDERRRLVSRLRCMCGFRKSHHEQKLASAHSGHHPPNVEFSARAEKARGSLETH